MAARFFVDENDLALGKALAQQHADVVFPGHRDLPEIARGMHETPDTVRHPHVLLHGPISDPLVTGDHYQSSRDSGSQR